VAAHQRRNWRGEAAAQTLRSLEAAAAAPLAARARRGRRAGELLLLRMSLKLSSSQPKPSTTAESAGASSVCSVTDKARGLDIEDLKSHGSAAGSMH